MGDVLIVDPDSRRRCWKSVHKRRTATAIDSRLVIMCDYDQRRKKCVPRVRVHKVQ